MSRAVSRLRWISLLCALAMLGGCGAKARLAHHLQRGEQYLSAGVLDKASVEFRNALQIEPRDPRALYLSGTTAERRGELREALGFYRAAVEADPANAAARGALCRLLVLAGAAREALPIIADGLERQPDDARLLTARAAARMQLNDPDGALADAEHAVKLAPSDEDAIAVLAGLYQRRADTPRAVQLVTTAVARQPASLALRRVLAGLYLGAHQQQQAEEQLQKIVALAPREAAPRYELASFYQRSGDIEAAQHVLEQAVAALPGSNQPRLALAEFLSQQRSPQQGEQLLRDYLAREPGNQELRLALARLLERAGATQQAEATLQAIIARDRSPYALTARERIAAIELATGDLPAARQQLNAVLQENPHDAEALLLRGQMALDTHDSQAAVADLRAVLRDRPGAADVQRLLARAYLAGGDTALAEATLRSALESQPAGTAGTALRLDLAQLLLGSGRGAQAVALLEQAVRESPRDTSTRAALVRAYLARGELAAARAAAEDLETLQPDSSLGRYLAGLVAEQQGHPDEARRELERALELEPRAVGVLAELTRLQLTHGQSAAALARVRAAALAAPQDAATLNLLGEVLVSTRAYGAAIEPLTRAVRLAPRWPAPYRNLAGARAAAGDPAGAEAAYRDGLKEAPYDPDLTVGLALLYEQQGQGDQAIALYEALHAHDPGLALASNNLAMLLVTHRGDHASLERARELTAGFARTENGALLDTHGWVLLRLGEVSAALPVLERAAARAPQSRVIRYHLAMAELRAGERDKARSDLQSALTGAGRFSGSDEARAALNTLIAAARG